MDTTGKIVTFLPPGIRPVADRVDDLPIRSHIPDIFLDRPELVSLVRGWLRQVRMGEQAPLPFDEIEVWGTLGETQGGDYLVAVERPGEGEGIGRAVLHVALAAGGRLATPDELIGALETALSLPGEFADGKQGDTPTAIGA